MKTAICSFLVLSVGLAFIAGCQNGATTDAPKSVPPTAEQKDPEAEIQASLAKLSPEDRKLADAQRYCAVENKNRLGSMGVPMQIMIQGEPVFLCCDGCETRARAHADRTLAKVRELKERTATENAK